MSEKDTLIVLAASYDSVSDAEVDYEAVKSLYNNAGVGHDFDAAVLERGDDGKVKVAHKHEESTRHGAWKGLAIGALAAILPGIGLGVGAAVGAGIGAVSGHFKGGMSNDDLKQLGAVLDKGQAGLIVIYATNMADQIAASIKAENRFVSDQIDADADELAKQLKAKGGTRPDQVSSRTPNTSVDEGVGGSGSGERTQLSYLGWFHSRHDAGGPAAGIEVLASRRSAAARVSTTSRVRTSSRQFRRSSRRALRRRWRRSTPSPNHTSAPNTAVTIVNSQSGHVKFQTKKWRVTSSVFWIMKMISTPTPVSEAIAPPLIRVPEPDPPPSG